jgi:hypothetical protein
LTIPRNGFAVVRRGIYEKDLYNMSILKPYVPATGPVADVLDYNGLLLRLGARDRAAVEKHMAVCESEPTLDHANLWKRVARVLCNLAPKALQTAGQRALQFFAADGKYRRQVFAMEDLRDGVLAVYMVDVLESARSEGLIRTPISKTGEGVVYVNGEKGPGVTLKMEALTSSNSAGAPDYYRHMVGWNRTVLKVTLPTSSASVAQIEALEALCAIAGRQAVVPVMPAD